MACREPTSRTSSKSLDLKVCSRILLFPNPLLTERTLGLNTMLSGFPTKDAYALCTFGYCAGPDKEPILFEGKTDGKIVPSRGVENFGWVNRKHRSSGTSADLFHAGFHLRGQRHRTDVSCSAQRAMQQTDTVPGMRRWILPGRTAFRIVIGHFLSCESFYKRKRCSQD